MNAGGAPARQRTLRAQGRQTMRKLLEAGIEVFDKRGYSGARVDDICERAGTSHGTFYLYFASKEDLFRALLLDVGEEMTGLAASLPAVPSDRSGYDAIRSFVEDFYDLYRHYHPVIRAWMETQVGDIEMAVMGAGVLGAFAGALADRVREIDPPPVEDPDLAALAMVAMVERFFYYSVIKIVPLERDRMLDTLAGMLHVGLFGGERDPRPATSRG